MGTLALLENKLSWPSLLNMDANLVATVIVGLVSLSVTIWLGRRSGLVLRPALRFLIGEVVQRGYRNHRRPVHHSIWLFESSVAGARLALPFEIVNPSKFVTVKDIRVDIDLPPTAYVTNEEIIRMLQLNGQADAAKASFLQSRTTSRFNFCTRIHYELGALAPGTGTGGTEIFQWECCDGDELALCPDYEDRLSANGFWNIVQRIRGLNDCRWFDVIRITIYGENLSPKVHYLNLAVFRADGNELKSFSENASPVRHDVRIEKLTAAESATQRFIQDVQSRYEVCFWMGKYPGKVWMPFPFRLSKIENCEFVPVVGLETKRKPRDAQGICAEVGKSVMMTSMRVPARDYYKFPTGLDDGQKLLLYHYYLYW